MLIGLGSLVAFFALCLRVLGDSAPEQKPPEASGRSDDDNYVIVEVPTAPSPFAYTEPSAAGGAASPESSATR